MNDRTQSVRARIGAAPKALRIAIVATLACAALTVVIAAVLGLGAIPWTDLIAALDRAAEWRGSVIAGGIALAAFVAGGLIVFPVNVLMAASIIVFGSTLGAIYALVGSVLSAAAVYEIGHRFPSGAFQRLVGTRGEWLRERVARHGVLAVALVRIVPVAPYSIVGLAAGAARIPRVAYLVGTALGMLPGIVLYAIFVDRAREVIANPRPLSWALLGFTIVLIAAVAWLVRRYRMRSARARASGTA